MAKQGWWMVVALLPAGLWAQASGTVKPVVKVGDVATYVVNMKADRRAVEETVTITSVDASQIKSAHVRPGRTSEGIATLEWGTVQGGGSGTRFDPPIQSLKFPLTVGDEWKSTYESTGDNQTRSKGDLAFRVVATEKLRIPAGEFDTFRIESKGWVTGITWQGSIQVRQTQWYAPSISRFVKTEFKDFRGGSLWNDTVTELKSFTPSQ